VQFFSSSARTNWLDYKNANREQTPVPSAVNSLTFAVPFGHQQVPFCVAENIKVLYSKAI